jgi:antitoxin (DNA-binding transcriptional repressor) of toxin-antitoxin stability system
MTLTLGVNDSPIDLAQLLEHARQGAEIVVLEEGQPVARFVLLDKLPTMRRMPGTAKGKYGFLRILMPPCPQICKRLLHREFSVSKEGLKWITLLLFRYHQNG